MADTALTFELDASELTRKMNRYVDELGLSGKEVVRDQTRLLLKQVIAFTPPKTLAQGRAAVARDIRRSMSPIVLDMFPLDRMRDRVEELVEKQDVTGLRAVFANSTSWNKWRVEHFSETLHTFARDRRGRVRQNRFIFITEATEARKNSAQSQLRRYVAKVQGFVGRLKAAWGPAYLAVGGTLPAWVARHSAVRGTVDVNFGNPQRPSIELRNFAAGVSQLIHPVQSAMRTRSKAMASDLKRKLREAANKAGLKKG